MPAIVGGDTVNAKDKLALFVNAHNLISSAQCSYADAYRRVTSGLGDNADDNDITDALYADDSAAMDLWYAAEHARATVGVAIAMMRDMGANVTTQDMTTDNPADNLTAAMEVLYAVVQEAIP